MSGNITSEWESEPDFLEWREPRSGYMCRIMRHARFKWLCGYVEIVMSHPYHGVSYERIADLGMNITFAGKRENSGRFWCGFDCGGYGELQPGLQDPLLPENSHLVYRNIAHVRAECESLAHRLRVIAENPWRFRRP